MEVGHNFVTVEDNCKGLLMASEHELKFLKINKKRFPSWFVFYFLRLDSPLSSDSK
jgi:hypothetical protein